MNEFDPGRAARERRTQEDRMVSTVVLEVGILVFILIGVGAWQTAAVRRECLRLGYATSSWGPIQGGYCETRVNQSDVVLPVADARKHPRTPNP